MCRYGARGMLQKTLRVEDTNLVAKVHIKAFLFDNDDRFFVGWKLDTSWIFCTVSWSILVVSGAAIVASAWLLSSEGGYELIPSEE